MDGAQVDTGDAGMAAQASRAASPTVDTHPDTDSTSPIIEHYAALLGALLDSVRGIMSSYKVPAQQGSPLDQANDWRSLRLSLRSDFGTPSSAFVADAASIYTGAAHRPKERAAQVIAAMERIGPAKLAEGCIELEREAFAGTGGQGKSGGRQAWYGAAEAISWLYAVRSAFLWDGSSDISPAQPTNSLPSQAPAPPAPFGFHSAPSAPISAAPAQQPLSAPLAFGFAPPPAPGLIAKQQEEKKMRLAASMAQPHPVPAAAPSRPTFWPTPAASTSSAAAPAPPASNPSPQPFASQAPAARPAPFAQPSAGPSQSKAAAFTSAMSALSDASPASPASTSAPVAPDPTPVAAPPVAPAPLAPPVPAIPIETSSARESPAPAPGSSHSTPAPIFETPPVLPTGPPSAGFAPPPPPSAPGSTSGGAPVDVKPKVRKQRASTGGIGTKKGKARGDEDDDGYMPAGARRAAANGGRAGSERPQRKRRAPLRLQDEGEEVGGEYDSWEEGWGSYLEDGAGEEKKKRRRTFSGFDDPSDEDEEFDDAELDVEELDELGSDYEEQVARKKAKKAKSANGGAGGTGRPGRKRGSLAGTGLTEQEQAEEDERLLNDPDRFKIGQAVMAKFPNYNFWPSVVLDHRTPPANTQGKRTPGAYLVKSVPTGGDHRWVSPDDSSIVPLTPTQLDDIILARYKSAPPTSWQKWRGELVDAALLIKDPEKLKEWLSQPTPAELYQLEQAEKKRAKRMSAFY